jgi:hypothetical protein
MNDLSPIVLSRRLSRVVRAAKRLVVDQGHARSSLVGRSVDREGLPVPWITYAAAAYLDRLDLREARVFEFGAGASTLYWQSRVREVVSVENDPAWVEMLGPKLNSHVVTLRLATDEDAYTASVEDGGPWDMVVIDGFSRHRAAQHAVKCLAPGAIVVLDNTDWFVAAAGVLRDAGLQQVDFAGPGPTKAYQWTTSVFLSRDTDLRFRYDPLVPKGNEPMGDPPPDTFPSV